MEDNKQIRYRQSFYPAIKSDINHDRPCKSCGCSKQFNKFNFCQYCSDRMRSASNTSCKYIQYRKPIIFQHETLTEKELLRVINQQSKLIMEMGEAIEELTKNINSRNFIRQPYMNYSRKNKPYDIWN